MISRVEAFNTNMNIPYIYTAKISAVVKEYVYIFVLCVYIEVLSVIASYVYVVKHIHNELCTPWHRVYTNFG
jgi:hypothetical protein